MLQCGLFEHDITPALGSEIPGKFFVRKSDGILDRLYAHAAFIKNDDHEACVIISVDVIFIPETVAEEARTSIADRLHIKKECIMLVATHSHTAGPVWSWGKFSHASEVYLEFLKARIVDAAQLAAERAHDVKISIAKGVEKKIAYVRDFKLKDGSVATNPLPEHAERSLGEIDPEVIVLSIDEMDGTPYGVFVNYACHCDCVNGTKYSADYPGAMRALLKKVYGDQFVPIFINGFNGDINHCDIAGHFHEVPKHYQRMGRILAADVIKTRETAQPMRGETIQGAHRYLTMQNRIPNAALLSWAKANEAGESSLIDSFYAHEVLQLAETGATNHRFAVQVVKIGQFAVFGMPGEIYSAFAKALKQRALTEFAASANLANGNIGYIPTKEMFLPGIYPARLCSSSKMPPETGDIMLETLLQLEASLVE